MHGAIQVSIKRRKSHCYLKVIIDVMQFLMHMLKLADHHYISPCKIKFKFPVISKASNNRLSIFEIGFHHST